MFSEVAEKFVNVLLNNGTLLEGFVSKVEDQYLTLIENDNSKVIVRLNDISMCRIPVMNSRSYQTPQKEFDENEYYSPAGLKQQSDYSMAVPSNTDRGIVAGPTFKRQT